MTPATARFDPETAAEAAERALDTGTEETALAPVEAAAVRARTSATLWQWTALLYRALDRREEALAAYDAAERLAPRDARIAHGVARTRLEAGLPSLDAFEMARRLAPHDGEVMLGRAAAQCAAGDVARAIADLDATLALSPEWLAGHDAVARLRWQAGERDEFTATIDRALAAGADTPALWGTLFSLFDHAGRYDDVLKMAALARRSLGDHPFILAHEAVALSEASDRKAADSAFACLRTHPDPALKLREARYRLRCGQPDVAIDLLAPLLEGPLANAAWPYLGTAWVLTDDPRRKWLESDPRFVGVYDIGDALPPLDRLATVLRGLHGFRHQPLDQSLRGGTQTDGALFHRIDPDIAAVRRVMAATVAHHAATLPPIDPHHPLLSARRDRPVRFQGSWSVRLSASGFHANHHHPHGWLSAALYVALPDGGPDHAGWLALGQPEAELGLDLPPARLIEPRPGRLVLFPSTMWHGTVPFAAGERLSIAFDVARPR